MRERSPPVAWAFIAFPVAIITVFTALPTLAGAGLSFFDWDGGGPPRFVGLENYRSALFADPQLWRALRNTLLFAAVTVPATVVGAFALAAALAAAWFRGAAAARAIFFMPTVMSIVAVGFVWQWMLNPRAGLPALLPWGRGGAAPDLLADSWVGLGTLMAVQVWKGLGFGVVLYAAALSRVPRSLHEAAAVDGASPWQAAWRVSWPAVAPVTAFLAITGAIWALQVFDLDLVMNGWSPQRYNDVLNTHVFREFRGGRLGYASTVGVVILALTGAVTWAQLRWFRAAGARA